MAPSLQAQSPATPVFQASTLFPPYSFFATPLYIIYGQEKGTETRKEGSRKGGAVHPLTQPKPRGYGAGQGFGPQPPRNPHSRSGTPTNQR